MYDFGVFVVVAPYFLATVVHFCNCGATYLDVETSIMSRVSETSCNFVLNVVELLINTCSTCVPDTPNAGRNPPFITILCLTDYKMFQSDRLTPSRGVAALSPAASPLSASLH